MAAVKQLAGARAEEIVHKAGDSVSFRYATGFGVSPAMYGGG